MDRVRVAFSEALQDLETSLQAEGELVLRSLRGAVNALVRHDLALADEVIAFDDEVDARYFAVEDEIQQLLATQTPVAADLRLVLAMLHANLHLERMADYCVTIAKLVKLAPDVHADPALIEDFADMGARAEEMTIVVLRAFAERDAAAARSLVELDALIDRANRRAHQRVLELGNERKVEEWGLRMLTISRSLERIGDHAVDIAEQVVYLSSGHFRELDDPSHHGDSA